MFTKYMRKLNLGLPKVELNLKDDEHTFGHSIQGTVEIKGGFIKNVLKRYEIDLVRQGHNSYNEELLNSRSVYCSKACIPNKKEILPFTINVPDHSSNQCGTFTYSLVVRAVLEDSQTILKQQPLIFKS